MNFLNFLTLEFIPLHPFTKILCFLTLLFFVATILLRWWNKKKFLNGFQNKIPHPYVGKTLNSLKAGTTLTKPTDIIYSHQMESNKNRFKENFAQSETNETNAKRREILDDILAPKNEKETNNLSYMDKYRADAHESKPFEKINPKSTPFFGQFEKKNPLLQNNVSTTSFDPMNYEKMKPNQSQNMSKIEKNQNYNYYMDTPSKKKEQENILTSYNKPKLNEKEISSFSTGAFSAFKKFGSPKEKEIFEKPKEISMTRNQTKEKIKNPYANMEKINHEELLLEKPIKIQKRKKKAKVENESIEEDSEEIRNEPRPSKKIKKDIKEKILLLKNKAKGYHFSGNSSEESLDEINYPILPNRNVFIKKTAEKSTQPQIIEKKKNVFEKVLSKYEKSDIQANTKPNIEKKFHEVEDEEVGQRKKIKTNDISKKDENLDEQKKNIPFSPYNTTFNNILKNEPKFEPKSPTKTPENPVNTIRFAGLKSDNEVLSKNNTKLKENKEISFGLADKSKEKLNEGFQQKLMSNISESIQKNEEKPTLNLETQKLKDPEEPKKNSMFSNITGPTIFSSHQPVFANKEEIKLPNSNEKVESNKPGLFSNLMNPSKTNLGFNNNGLSAFSSNETKLGLFSQTDNELKLKTSPVKTTLFNYCNPEKILTNPNDNTKKEPFSLFNNNKVENNTDINKTNIFGNLSANSTNSLFGNHSTLNLNHDNGMRNLFGVKTVNNEESTGGLFGPNKITATGLFSNLSNSGPVGNSQQIQNKD